LNATEEIVRKTKNFTCKRCNYSIGFILRSVFWNFVKLSYHLFPTLWIENQDTIYYHRRRHV